MRKFSLFSILITLFGLFVQPFLNTPSSAQQPPINKNIYLIIYNPVLENHNNQKLTTYMNWQDPDALTSTTISWFQTISGGRINYSVAKRVESDSIPVKQDGFMYTDDSILACYSNSSLCHSPDAVDYSKILIDFGVCDALNNNQIDEVWMFGGPYFGYYESRLAGPNGYWYNSSPLTGTTCNKLVPIMGFSYERQLNEMVHDFGHRTESTMSRVYGDWSENRTRHPWDMFGLVKKQSPNYTYSGCGSVHYPPNGLTDYDYQNQAYVNSNCDDFFNYPNLQNPPSLKSVNCSAWGCSEIGYYEYWFKHIPSVAGNSHDGTLNDWWQYIMDPNKALLPTQWPDSVNPTVSITNPTNNSKVLHGSQVTISSSASDNTFLDRADFYVNQILVCSDKIVPYQCVWNVPSKRSVKYSIKVVAFDTTGNSSSKSVTVTSR